ncbi:MAG: hypothetical protein HFE61_07125 [Anaerotignum sp.]|jgi:hypothetical protein|nr:hypothetical protein [Anaerotignum sp.]
MPNIFIEENGRYRIDCSKAVWATDKMHDEYQRAGIHIKDVDFVIETEDYLILLEYKNANIQGAKKPHSFNPEEQKKYLSTTRKFYDSLHFLKLMNKAKPLHFIYVLEYPNGDMVTRKRLREKMKLELPFALQKNIGNGIELINKFDVVSIAEWNSDEEYGKYPLSTVDRI